MVFRLQKHSVLSVVYKIINPKKSGEKELSGMMRKSVSHPYFSPAAYAELFLSRVPVGTLKILCHFHQRDTLTE